MLLRWILNLIFGLTTRTTTTTTATIQTQTYQEENQEDEPQPEPQHDEPAPPEPQPLYHTYPIEHRSGTSNSTISIPEDATLFTAPGHIELYPPTGDQRNTIPIEFVSSAEPPEYLQNPEVLDYRFHFQIYTPEGTLHLAYEPEDGIHQISLQDFNCITSTTIDSFDIRVTTTNLPPPPPPEEDW